MKTPVKISKYFLTVGSDIHNEAAIGAAFHICPWLLANIAQKRCNITEGRSTPCSRKSRSRNVLIKLFLQEKLSASFLERNDSGNPPLSQSRRTLGAPTSDTSNPPTSPD